MMGGPIDPRARKALGRSEVLKESRVRRERDARANGMSLTEYDAWLDKEGARLAAEAAADPSTNDI